MTSRADYRLGNCEHLPFNDQTFDGVFTDGSLHEWANPRAAFDEIWRVLKPGSRYYISDLRREMGFPFLYPQCEKLLTDGRRESCALYAMGLR